MNRRKLSTENVVDISHLRWSPWRSSLFRYFENPHESYVGLALHYTLLASILLNLSFLCLETLDGPNQKGSDPQYAFLPFAQTYYIMEMVFTFIFTLEFLARGFTSPDLKKLSRDPLTWCDLAAIFPFYLNVLIYYAYNVDEDQNPFLQLLLNMIKLFRVLRIVKMARVSERLKEINFIY